MPGTLLSLVLLSWVEQAKRVVQWGWEHMLSHPCLISSASQYRKGEEKTFLAERSQSEQHKEGKGALRQCSGKSRSPSGCYQKGRCRLRPWFYRLLKKRSLQWPHRLCWGWLSTAGWECKRQRNSITMQAEHPEVLTRDANFSCPEWRGHAAGTSPHWYRRTVLILLL